MENSLEILSNFIGNFGFPIVITFYLIMIFERKLDKLESAITNLSNKINDKK